MSVGYASNRSREVQEIVRVAKAGTPYKSIAAAIASITDASPSKPYLIQVAPGVYTEPELTPPAYVSITGSTIQPTIVTPDAPTHHAFRLTNPYSEISYLTVNDVGAAGSGLPVSVVTKLNDTATLPQSTIVVDDTTGFAASGSIRVTTASGQQTVAYTGKTGTSFTGCSGGVGAMSVGGGVLGPGGGYAGVAVINVGDFAQLHKISMNNCDTGLYVEGSTIDTKMYAEYLDFNGAYTHGTVVISTDAFLSSCNAENYYNFPASSIIRMNMVIGSNAILDQLTTGSIGIGSEIYLDVMDGATANVTASYAESVGSGVRAVGNAIVTLSGVAFGDVAADAIVTPSAGPGAQIHASGVLFQNCTTNINIQNDGTTGHFTGYSEHGKTVVVAASTFFITGKDRHRVTVAKEGADFTSVADAMSWLAGLTGADAPSISSPYEVSIEPGTFMEPPFSMLPFVTVTGNPGGTATVLATTNNSSHFITGAASSCLTNVSILGPTGVGFAAIYHATPGVLMRVENCYINGYYGLWVHHATTRTTVRATYVANYSTPDMDRFFYVTGFGAISGTDCSYSRTNRGQTNIGFAADGANTNVLMQGGTFFSPVTATTIAAGSNGATLPQSTVNVASTLGFPASGTIYVTTSFGVESIAYTGKTGTTFTGCTGGTGTMSTGGRVIASVHAVGVFADNGATVRMTSYIFLDGFTAVRLGSSGSSEFRAAGCIADPMGFQDGYHLESLGATNKLGWVGALRRDKLSITPGTEFTTIASDATSTAGAPGAIIIGEMWSGRDKDSLSPLREVAENEASTGLVNGGDVSVATGLSLGVAAGHGHVNTCDDIADTGKIFDVRWGAGALTLSANSTRWVYVDTAGAIQQASSEPDNAAAIVLGVAVTDASNIRFLATHSLPVAQAVATLHDYLVDVVGPISVSGCLASINSPPSLKLDVDAGDFYLAQTRFSAVAGTAITFTPWYYSGSAWVAGADTDTVDTAQYNSGLSGLISIPASRWVGHLLFVTTNGGGEQYHLLYAQQDYASQVLSEQGENPTGPDFLIRNALRLARITVQQGGTQIASLVDERPKLGQLASGSTAVTSHGALTGLAADDHPQYLLVNGSRAMSGTLQMGSNNITIGVGNTVDGRDISVDWTASSTHFAATSGTDAHNSTATPTASRIVVATGSGRIDKGWIPDFIASGASHASGGVPDPGAAAGTTKFLREDATWSAPSAAGAASGDLAGTYPAPTVSQSSTAFALNSPLSPAAISAGQNDYNPAGFASANFLRLTATTGVSLTGFVGGTSGRILTVHNVGSFDITLAHEDTGSGATNRFNFPGGTGLILTPDKGITLQYDSTTGRWRSVGDITVSTASGDLAGSYPAPTVARSSTAFALSGVISATITSNQTDYTPTGLSGANTLRVTATGSAWFINSLTGGASGRILAVHNVGALNVTLLHDDGSTGTAANRFVFPGAASLVLTPNKGVALQYDATSARWRSLGPVDPYGTVINTICQGNDSRLSDARTPTGAASGDLTGSYPGPTIALLAVTAAKIANATITDVQVAAANKDGTAATPSLRTLGTAATQACAGNDSRLSDARTPTAHAASHLPGGTDALTTAAPSATGVATASAVGTAASFARSDHAHQSNTAPANVTKAAATIGTSGEPARADHKHDITTAAAVANPPGSANAEGTSTSLSRADHVHALAAFGSTSGTFCQGNDSRLSDARTPTGAAGGDLAGTYANPTVAQSSTAFALNGVISPTSLSTSQNDYNPTSLSTASFLRLTSSAAVNITGLQGGASGRLITIHNIGSNTITLTSDDGATSTAANRFVFPGAASFVLTPNRACVLQYDATSSRWRALDFDEPVYGSSNTNVHVFESDALYSGSGSAASANLVQYSRVWMKAGTVIAAMRTHLTGGANSARTIRMGIYGQATATSNTGAPTTQLVITPTPVSNATGQPTTGTTGAYDVAFTTAYTIPTSGWYWFAIQPSATQLAFAVSATFRANSVARREESPGAGLPSPAGTTTQPQSAVILVAAVE